MLKSVSVGGLALLATGLLFTCMHALIREPNITIHPTKPRLYQAVQVNLAAEKPIIQPPAQLIQPNPMSLFQPRLNIDPIEFSEARPKVAVQKPNLIKVATFKPNLTFANQVDSQAVTLASANARYPTRALQDGVSGWVTVEMSVDPDGSVAGARVIEASPEGYFEKATLKAIRKFRFRPKMVEGVPTVAHGVLYRMTFDMAGS